MNRLSMRSTRGFSLTELVVVIVIVTILSAFALARINTTSFEAEGFSKELAATMRYAQKIAIAQRRNVAVTISAAGISLTYPGLADAPLRFPVGTNPAGGTDYTIFVPPGVGLSGTLFSGADVTYVFTPIGKLTSSGSTVGGTLIVSGGDLTPVTITVEEETGYVH